MQDIYIRQNLFGNLNTDPSELETYRFIFKKSCLKHANNLPRIKKTVIVFGKNKFMFLLLPPFLRMISFRFDCVFPKNLNLFEKQPS